MKEYVLSVAGIVLLCATLGILLPSGKMGKAINGFLKVACLSVLVAPFARLEFGEGAEWLGDDILTDASYVAACEQFAEDAVEEEVVALINGEYSLAVTALADCEEDSPFSVKSIQISVPDLGIFEDGQHIDIVNEMTRLIEERYLCEVTVYGVGEKNSNR